MNLKYLTDRQLLLETKHLAEEERRLTARLLHHLKEIENRKLYAELGYSSLFKYLVVELGFSEGAASRRINCSRLLSEIPEIQKKIEDGKLTLTNLSKVAEKFKNENIKDINFKKEIIETIENSSTRTCDKTLGDIIGPDKLPLQPFRKLQIINVAIAEDIYSKYDEIRGLLAHHKLNKEEIFEKIFDLALAELKKRKFKTNSKQAPKESSSRYVSAGLKKAVYTRDRVCVKCGSNQALEIDHRIPYALGGKTDLKNLRMLCRSCNQRSRISANLHLPYK